MAEAKVADRLKEEVEHYLEARLELMLRGFGERLGEGARRLGEGQLPTGGGLTGAVSKTGKKLIGHALTSTASHAKDTLLEKAGGITDLVKPSGEKGHEKPSGGTGRGLTIIEDIDVGVPVREAYNQWTQFTEFERFAKGVQNVEQKDDVTTQWHVKVAKASRSWRGTITEQVPDQRIAWISEGPKATTKGVVTFHPLAENLTKVLLVLEYFPKGVVERVGGLIRAQGRRARLDLKLYRTFVMTRGDATGGWRGEIREGEVVRGPEEAEEGREEGREKTKAKGEEEEREEEEEEKGERRGERRDEGEGERRREPRDEDEDEYEDRDDREDQEDEEDEEPEDTSTSEEDDEWEENEDEQPDDRYDEREASEGRRRRG